MDSSLLQFCAIDRIPPLERGGNRVRELRRLESRMIIRYGSFSNGTQ